MTTRPAVAGYSCVPHICVNTSRGPWAAASKIKVQKAVSVTVHKVPWCSPLCPPLPLGGLTRKNIQGPPRRERAERGHGNPYFPGCPGGAVSPVSVLSRQGLCTETRPTGSDNVCTKGGSFWGQLSISRLSSSVTRLGNRTHRKDRLRRGHL